MIQFTFFFDRNMSVRLAEMTAIYVGKRHIVQHHDKRFQQDTPDVEWLESLGKDNPKPIVISGDAAILKNKAERAVLRKSNLSFFCMQPGWTEFTFQEQVWMFYKVWPLIVASADIQPPRQFDVRVGNKPKVEVGLPTNA